MFINDVNELIKSINDQIMMQDICTPRKINKEHGVTIYHVFDYPLPLPLSQTKRTKQNPFLMAGRNSRITQENLEIFCATKNTSTANSAQASNHQFFTFSSDH